VKAPPPVIDGASVLEYAILDESVTFTGALHLYAGKERVGAVPRLAICHDSRTNELVLFHCDPEWNVIAAQAWNGPAAEPVTSMDDVKQRAEKYYTGLSAKWVTYPWGPAVVLSRRVVLGFVAAALGVPALIGVTSLPDGLWFAAMISMFTVPLTLFAGVPLFVLLARRRRVTFWWCLLAGFVVGVVGVLLLMLTSNVIAARNWAPILIIIGLLCSMVFWVVAVRRNPALDKLRR